MEVSAKDAKLLENKGKRCIIARFVATNFS